MAYDNRSAPPPDVERAPSFVSRLAASACELRLGDLPADARAHGAAMLADTIAVMVAGARQPEVRAFAGHADPLFLELFAGPCSLLTPEAQHSDALSAAFVNGTAGTFLELDSGIRPTGHPAVHVVPAALAAAQALRAPGDALLIATISGYEVAARLFRAYRLRFPVHPHGHLGAVGAAVAVARLSGRDPAAAADMAASLSLLTVWTPCFEGATVRNTYSGMAATIGLLANKLLAGGFTGSGGAQEVAFGELVGERADDADELLDVDPRRLALMDGYMKVYSACALSHTTIEAALDLGPIAADEIERVEVETTANNLKLDRAATANSLSTRFSLPYAAAAAIVHGHADPEAFEPDERVFALAARVDVRANPAFDREWPQASPAQVTAHVAGGTRSAHVANPRGYPARSLDHDAIRAKFEALTGPSNGGKRRYDFDRLLAIETLADSAAIFDPST
jgi:2-methylcitrate dehydratase PrpD